MLPGQEKFGHLPSREAIGYSNTYRWSFFPLSVSSPRTPLCQELISETRDGLNQIHEDCCIRQNGRVPACNWRLSFAGTRTLVAGLRATTEGQKSSQETAWCNRRRRKEGGISQWISSRRRWLGHAASSITSPSFFLESCCFGLQVSLPFLGSTVWLRQCSYHSVVPSHFFLPPKMLILSWYPTSST